MMSRPTAVRPAGFIEVAILMILVFLLGVGLLYYQTSLQGAQTIIHRAELLKARNLARAGLEKGLLYVHEVYAAGGSDLKYEDSRRDPRLAGNLPTGDFRVTRIEPVRRLAVDPRTELEKVFVDQPYRIGKSDRGRYDLLRIRALGETRVASIELETLVKVIREEVKY